jgi:predicted transcriptional regulator
MKRLTDSEERIMQILWKIKKGFVNDVIAEYTGPKPAYTTVSSIIRILEKKGFVAHKAYGPTHQYYPLIDKDEYTQRYLSTIVKDYFDNSYSKLVSFFAQNKKLRRQEIEEILKIIGDLDD